MKLVLISDTHCQHDQVIIPECDILLHAGDFSYRGTQGELMNFVQWFSKQPAKYKLATCGNHDWGVFYQPQMWQDIFKVNGCHLLLDETIDVEGLKIFGSPWSVWFHSWAYNFSEDDDGTQAASTWSKIPDDVDVIVVHGPPYGIGDLVARAYPGEDPHVGCPELLKRIDQLEKLKLVVTAHIHEAYGQYDYRGKTIINAAVCTLDYKPTNKPIVIEL